MASGEQISGEQSCGRDQPSRRRALRFPLQAPVDVTVLRSGIPDTLPGRSVDLGEGGVAAMLAGELSPGEAVGVEIRLPATAYPVRARALVRHHDKLRAGLEFVALSEELRSAIRESTGLSETEPERHEPVALLDAPAEGSENGESGDTPPGNENGKAKGRRPAWLWIFLAAFAVALLVFGWWRWNRGWQELESGIQKSELAQSITPEVRVPAEVMEKLVTHRVDPEYPAAARPANLQGVVVLDVLVGSDGSVISARPVTGAAVLTQAAVDALRWWRFDPYRIDGRPVAVETTVAVEFKP
jgi:TonB family protein